MAVHEKGGADEVIIRSNMILPLERQALLDWAIPMRPHLNANGPGRTFRKVSQLPHIPSLYRDVRLRIQEWLGVDLNAAPEPMFGWYLSIISDGGAVHEHMDPSPLDRRHLRCNLFLQLPELGGFPIIEGQTHPVQEGGVLAFFPSEKKHASHNVEGTRWRVICSFGYLVLKSYSLPPPSRI